MNSLILILIVGVGGAIGTTLRFLLSYFFKSHIPKHTHLATWCVNTVGCFFIGFFFILFQHHISTLWRDLIITGIMGGLTTFSSFSLDNVKLIEQQRYKILVLYIIITILCGAIALLLGIGLGTLLF